MLSKNHHLKHFIPLGCFLLVLFSIYHVSAAEGKNGNLATVAANTGNKKPARVPKTAIFEPNKCYAVTSVQNNNPLYTFRLKLTKANAVKYIIQRQKYGNSETLTTFAPVPCPDMIRSGFVYEDSVTEPGKYQYFVYTENASGERSEANSIILEVCNIHIRTEERRASIDWDETDEGSRRYQALVNEDPLPPVKGLTELQSVQVPLMVLSDLSAKKIYYFWVRTVDDTGAVGSWSCRKFSPAPETARFVANNCISVSETRDGQPIYLLQLKIGENYDAASYLLTRQNYQQSDLKKSFNISYTSIANTGFTFIDNDSLTKHTTYVYQLISKNALGETSRYSDALKLTVENVPLETNRIVQELPQNPGSNLTLNFKLGPKTDPEGDELLYRLYIRTSGVGPGMLAQEWAPTQDEQEVSYTFKDNGSYEWQMRCIEKDAEHIIIPREIYDPTWRGQGPEIENPEIKIVAKTNQTTTHFATKQQPVEFEVQPMNNQQLSNFQWNFGDGSTSMEPTPSHKYSTLTPDGQFNLVTVNATDENGKQLQSAFKIAVVNTSHGTLYSDETWSESHVVDGEVIVPAGITLTIAPETLVVFQATGRIVVQGKLYAVDPGKKIQLDWQSGPDNWRGVLFKDTGSGELDGVSVRHVEWGINVSDSGTLILKNVFFTDNVIGLGYYGGIAIASDCVFSNNPYCAVYNQSEVSNPQLIHCYFAGNSMHYYDYYGPLLTSEELNQISGNEGNVIE